jgi:hypothetical protein
MSEVKKCIECEAPILSKNMSRHMQNAHGVLPKKRIKLEEMDKSSKWNKMDLSHLLSSTDSQNESETKDASNDSETKDAPNDMYFDIEQVYISIRALMVPKVKCAHCSKFQVVSNYSRHRQIAHAEIHAKNPKIICTI